MPQRRREVNPDNVQESRSLASWMPQISSGTPRAIAGGHVILHSLALIDECMTFVTTDAGSQEAQPGKYDDRVMALGIAWQVRKRPLSRGSTVRPQGW